MAIVSYAQNFEDVMLWRALKHIEHGFYVDIGAQDPLIDSVSLAFYECGWRGVHVEPTQQYSNKLRVARPDELILQLAIGNQPGSLTFYEFEDTGLSTADPSIARRHQEAGFRCHETVVSVISLDALFERIGVQIIHWLKLDVEGLEKSVLESWKSDTVLPWLLIIESTQPLTQDECHKEWEHLILAKGYEFVYFDGLNRFYVSANHVDLADAFRSPPNIFDGFVLSGTASQPFYKLVESKGQVAESKAKEAFALVEHAEAMADHSKLQLELVLASRTWKVANLLASPIKHIHKLKKLCHQGKPKLLLKIMLFQLMRLSRDRPTIKLTAKKLASSLGLTARLKRIYWTALVGPVGLHHNLADAPHDLKQLNPRAHQIYSDLKSALKHRHDPQR